MDGAAKAKQPHHDLHLQFSIPASSVNEARDLAKVAGKVVTRFKKWL